MKLEKVVKEKQHIVQVHFSDEYFLGATNKGEEDSIKLNQNHSFNPNVGLNGEITFIAMRDIKKDEELTVDYALIDNEDYTFECTCGSDN